MGTTRTSISFGVYTIWVDLEARSIDIEGAA
jgi:hypothetical protein